MYPSQFDYFRPASIKEAIGLLGDHPDAKILAGGHSLVPALKLRLAAPSALVDIGRIAELSGIKVANGAATIGAMTTYRQLQESADLKSAFPIIAETANVVGDPAVRSRGTLGGALAHSDPAADFPATMLALNASVKAVGPNGERTIGIDDLFVDLFTTALDPSEVLTEISIPASPAGAGSSYQKHAHPASGYAVVGIAAVITVSGGKVSSVRIGVTGAGAKAARAKASEAILQGNALTPELIAQAAAVAADGIDLNSDIYASAEYRGHLVKVLTKRAITAAAGL
jgi:aerobic carbon-monoxide dehydrogenase medium subunit